MSTKDAQKHQRQQRLERRRALLENRAKTPPHQPCLKKSKSADKRSPSTETTYSEVDAKSTEKEPSRLILCRIASTKESGIVTEEPEEGIVTERLKEVTHTEEPEEGIPTKRLKEVTLTKEPEKVTLTEELEEAIAILSKDETKERVPSNLFSAGTIVTSVPIEGGHIERKATVYTSSDPLANRIGDFYMQPPNASLQAITAIRGQLVDKQKSYQKYLLESGDMEITLPSLLCGQLEDIAGSY